MIMKYESRSQQVEPQTRRETPTRSASVVWRIKDQKKLNLRMKHYYDVMYWIIYQLVYCCFIHQIQQTEKMTNLQFNGKIFSRLSLIQMILQDEERRESKNQQLIKKHYYNTIIITVNSKYKNDRKQFSYKLHNYESINLHINRSVLQSGK